MKISAGINTARRKASFHPKALNPKTYCSSAVQPSKYGQTLGVALIGHIRGQEVFSGLDELMAAMDRDAQKARTMLAAARPLSDLDARLRFFG